MTSTALPSRSAPRALPQDVEGRLLAVRARDLRLDGKRGRIYGPLDLDLEAGSLTVLTGRAGTGKTSLLLSVTGRMNPSAGELTVLGYELPRQARSIQHRTSAMGIAGLDDLDEEVSVGACVRERQAWLAKPWKIVRSPDDESVARVCAPAFGDLPVPRAGEIVHELPEASNLLLRIALAMLSKPQLIVVDEIDQLHDLGERDLIWHRLEAIAASGLTVVTAASGAAELDRVRWTRPPLHVALPDHETVTLSAVAAEA